MRNLLKFFTRFHFFFLFVIFEAISFTLIIQNNNYHKAKYFNFANAVSGFFYNQFSQMSDYLSLRRTNLDLAEENVRLFNSMKDFYKSDDSNFYLEIDSIYQQQYYFTPAKVINNSINKQNNFLTVNKGRKHGITPEMAVISQNGIVGIIKNVSPNFSTVISVLNSNLRFSAKMKKITITDQFFGRDWTIIKHS